MIAGAAYPPTNYHSKGGENRTLTMDGEFSTDMGILWKKVTTKSKKAFNLQ